MEVNHAARQLLIALRATRAAGPELPPNLSINWRE